MYSLYHFPNINFAKIKKGGCRDKGKTSFQCCFYRLFFIFIRLSFIFVCEVAFFLK